MSWRLLARIFDPMWVLPAAVVGGGLLVALLDWGWLEDVFDFALPIAIFQWMAFGLERAIRAGLADLKPERFDHQLVASLGSRALLTMMLLPAAGIFDPGFWLVISPLLLWAGPLLDRWLARRHPRGPAIRAES